MFKHVLERWIILTQNYTKVMYCCINITWEISLNVVKLCNVTPPCVSLWRTLLAWSQQKVSALVTCWLLISMSTLEHSMCLAISRYLIGHLFGITLCGQDMINSGYASHGIVTNKEKETTPKWLILMMTSSNRNIFRFTDHLCGEFTGHRWIPSQRPVTRSFDVFICV